MLPKPPPRRLGRPRPSTMQRTGDGVRGMRAMTLLRSRRRRVRLLGGARRLVRMRLRRRCATLRTLMALRTLTFIARGRVAFAWVSCGLFRLIVLDANLLADQSLDGLEIRPLVAIAEAHGRAARP